MSCWYCLGCLTTSWYSYQKGSRYLYLQKSFQTVLYLNVIRTSSSLLSALHVIKLCSWLSEWLCVCSNLCYFHLPPEFLLSSKFLSYSEVIFKLSLSFAECRNIFFSNGSWDRLLWIYSADKPLKEIVILMSWWWKFQLFAAFLTPQNQLLFRVSWGSVYMWIYMQSKIGILSSHTLWRNELEGKKKPQNKYMYLERLLSCILFLLSVWFIHQTLP